jgi:hypothetical protein
MERNECQLVLFDKNLQSYIVSKTHIMILHNLITHVVYDSTPGQGFKQVSPICSNEIDLEKGIYFWGYNAKRELTEEQLLPEEGGNSICYKLPQPIKIPGRKFVWINERKEILLSNTARPDDQPQTVGKIE